MGQPSKGGPGKATRPPPRAPDPAARRLIAGGPTVDESSIGVESAGLQALREAERELFPPAAPGPSGAWPSDLPLLMPRDGDPLVRSSGVPPSSAPPPPGDAPSDLSWLGHLEMPDLPVRWDDRVIRYLAYFKDDPRGHATFAYLYRRSGRVRDLLRRAIRKKSLPDDLVWVAMIESGFDPAARSSAGAAGLWQFMPETGRIYGLLIDRWLDQRYSAALSTGAATDLLADLHRRFGTWELALAAYNMGYVGLATVVRRYNTNDFWALSRAEGSLPWETTLYVPKILAAAVVAHNLAAFGFGDLTVDPPIESDPLEVPPGTTFTAIAQAASCDAKEVESLNPELRAGRTPPADPDGSPAVPYIVRVPMGKGAAAARVLVKLHREAAPVDRYVVRFGETLDQIAVSHKTTVARLVDLNAIAPGEALRGGTLLLVPVVDEPAAAASSGSPAKIDRGPRADLDAHAADPSGAAAAARPTVIVPAAAFVYPDRQRVFYRVLVGDTLPEIAGALHVAVDDLRRWNDLDAGARLEEGMTLQAFVAKDADLSRVVVLSERDAHVVAVGSDEFFASLDPARPVKRLVVAAKAGDTLESIGRRFNVSARTMERINRRGRGEALRPGETVTVYVPVTGYGSSASAAALASASAAAAGSGGASAAFGAVPGVAAGPVPNGPVPEPPIPDLLPDVAP